MARKRKKCYSGIGGQAVLEGIMMKNKDRYAVAVRRPNGKVAVEPGNYQGLPGMEVIKKIPFVRGIFAFLESMILGTRCLNLSASLYDDEGEEKDGAGDKLMTTLVTVFAIALAVGIFVVLPNYLASIIGRELRNASLLTIIEGAIRIAVFILYVLSISLMKDIRRLYRYHGAEHKCINCIERGRPLTVKNVMRSSRLHRRCGTSFIFFVLFVSIVLFFFVRAENLIERAAVRILLMPVVAGISYEIIRLAGRFDNILVRIVSAPGMLVQRLTTKEPDESMVEVAIAAVEAVFDWKEYLRDNFGYGLEEEQENAGAAPEE